MQVLHPELHKAVSDLDLTQESKGLLLETFMKECETIVPNDALRLIGLLGNLRSDRFMGLVPLQKKQLLENFLNLTRQKEKEWVFRVCFILYEGDLGRLAGLSLLPKGMARDLLRWVNGEKAEKVRESLWAILLRKEVGLGAVAGIADVAMGLCEKDPIIRNTVIRFLSQHFPPNDVVDSLLQFSMASSKRIPGVVFRRYASLFKTQEDLQQKKYVLGKILSTATLDDKEMGQILSDYMKSANRFDLIRFLSSSQGNASKIADSRRKGGQMSIPYEQEITTLSRHSSFCERISLAIQDLA